jgi:hypothetical protein
MMTWSTSKSSPLAAKSVQTNVGQSPSSLLNLFRFSTLSSQGKTQFVKYYRLTFLHAHQRCSESIKYLDLMVGNICKQSLLKVFIEGRQSSKHVKICYYMYADRWR